MVLKKPCQVLTKVSLMGAPSLSIRRDLGLSALADPIVGNPMIVVKVHNHDVGFALRSIKKQVQKSGLL